MLSMRSNRRWFTSTFGGAGVVAAGFLAAAAPAFFVADVAVADVFLSVMLEFTDED